jgi:O-antigen/teichoic acid export membrane protein
MTLRPSLSRAASVVEAVNAEEAPSPADAIRTRGQARDHALRASMASALLVKLATVGCGTASVAISVRALGDVRFGVLAALTTLTGLLAFADFGIGGGLMTQLAVADGHGDLRRARTMISAALSGMVGLGSLVGAVGVLSAVALPWNRLLGAPALDARDLRTAVAVFFILAGAAIPASIGQRMLVGLQRGLVANLWLLAGSVVSLVSVLMAVWIRSPLWCFVLASTGTPVVIAAIQSTWVLARRHEHLRPSRHLVTRASLRSLAGVSGLFFVLNIATTVAYQADVIIVASTLGAGSAAVFAVTLRMFSLVSGTLAGASQQMWTAMAEALAYGDVNWVKSRLLRILIGTLAVSVPCAILLIVLGRPLARTWVGPDLMPPVGLLAAFALWTVYSPAMTQLSYLLNAAQVVGPQVAMALLMATANLALSLYLTRHIGIAGPVVGSLATHLIFAGVPAVILAVRVLRKREAAKAHAWNCEEKERRAK